jgi:acyl-coenzyme A thioesterase PaaI-like protein
MTPAELTQGIHNLIPFVGRSGLEVLAYGRGYAKLRLPAEPNKNHVGTIYGGALCTAAEVPGGVLVAGSFDVGKYYPIVKSIDVQFKRAATADVTIEARLTEDELVRVQAEADAKGKADFTVVAEIKDEAGTVVAVSRGVYQLRQVGR